MEGLLVLSGAALSVLFTLFKNYLGDSQWLKTAVVLLLSLLVAAAYTIMLEFNLWEGFLQIAVTAGAVYSYIIKNTKETAQKMSLNRT